MGEVSWEQLGLKKNSECGHNIDTDLVEELTGEADRFLRWALTDGTWYEKVTE